MQMHVPARLKQQLRSDEAELAMPLPWLLGPDVPTCFLQFLTFRQNWTSRRNIILKNTGSPHLPGASLAPSSLSKSWDGVSSLISARTRKSLASRDEPQVWPNSALAESELLHAGPNSAATLL